MAKHSEYRPIILANNYSNNALEAGCDEAGRGCLAGPVVAAAVILPIDYHLPGLNDSKQLSEKKRNELRKIIELEAVAWAVSFVDEITIDEINILNASILGMHRALDQLTIRPEHIAVDGNRFKTYQSIPHTCLIKGDARFLNIAAASILAKTHRDEYMQNLHLQYPEYLWNKNKGYPAPAHRQAIALFGANENHRKSFRLLPDQFKLNLN